MKPALIAVFLAQAFMAQARAQGDGFSLAGMSANSIKSDAPGVSSPVPAATIRATTLDDCRNNLLRRQSNEGDTVKRLYKDTLYAIEEYEGCKASDVTYSDDQRVLTTDFYMNAGGSARLNPNSAQTAALEKQLNALMAMAYKPNQALVIFEALLATNGNVTLAAGSLAELFCKNRNKYIPNVRDMYNWNGKNYYRYAGMFIGLHPTLFRIGGGAAAYSSIIGNPVVFAGAEIYDWWFSFIKTGRPENAGTFSISDAVTERSEYNSKIPELEKGLNAAALLRKWKLWDSRFGR